MFPYVSHPGGAREEGDDDAERGEEGHERLRSVATDQGRPWLHCGRGCTASLRQDKKAYF